MVVPVRMQIKKILISFLFCLHQTLLWVLCVASFSDWGAPAVVGDPPIIKGQGLPRSKRLRTGLDLVPPTKKPCGYCESNEHITSHCPSKPAKKYTKALIDKPLMQSK
jgi:hypothetical protein